VAKNKPFEIIYNALQDNHALLYGLLGVTCPFYINLQAGKVLKKLKGLKVC
jgi:hypothetical protein